MNRRGKVGRSRGGSGESGKNTFLIYVSGWISKHISVCVRAFTRACLDLYA